MLPDRPDARRSSASRPLGLGCFPGRTAIRPTEGSKAAVCYVRNTSTPAVTGQRSTAGFSLQIGNDCSSGFVCSERQDRFLNVVRCHGTRPAFTHAEQAFEAANRAEEEAPDALCCAPPTTIAGVRAAIEYVELHDVERG
jgi:hypothetical protein